MGVPDPQKQIVRRPEDGKVKYMSWLWKQNKYILLYMSLWGGYYALFFSFLNFCKLQHLSFNSSDKLKWEQSDSTPRTEAVYTRLPFQFCRTKRGFCHSFGYLNLSLCLSAQPLTFWGSWITSHVWPQYYIFFSPQIIFSQNLQLLKEHTSLGNAPFLSYASIYLRGVMFTF